MRRLPALAIATVLSLPAAAWAQDFPRAINEPPRGPGTEQPPKVRTSSERVSPGWEAQFQFGGGIGFGIGGKAGYSFVPGLYLGAFATHFFGPSVNTIDGESHESQTIFGGDVAYKFFPAPAIELRPFVLAGAGVFKQLQELGQVETNTKFVLAPGFLAAYHFGNAFVSAEGRLELTPTPVRVAILAGLGLGI